MEGAVYTVCHCLLITEQNQTIREPAPTQKLQTIQQRKLTQRATDMLQTKPAAQTLSQPGENKRRMVVMRTGERTHPQEELTGNSGLLPFIPQKTDH